ncbi:phosphotransferase [Paraburkholderia sp. CNPSo 3155]|nr:phosphotransferase [Paraburkholderia atlantica]
MMPDVEISPGTLLGTGCSSDVFDQGDGWVLKLFHPQCPQEYVQTEAILARAVYAAAEASGAFRVPAVGALLPAALHGRNGILYAKAAGTALPVALRGATPRHVGERLADLHRAIHVLGATTHPALAALPLQQMRLGLAIQQAPGLSDMQRDALRALLEMLTARCRDNRLCHGDFHPFNVLQDTGGGATLIDWMTAEMGDPLCDVARSIVRLRFAPAPGAISVAPAENVMRRLLADAYLQRYSEALDTPDARERVGRWLPLAIAARLADGIGANESATLGEWLAGRLGCSPEEDREPAHVAHLD